MIPIERRLPSTPAERVEALDAITAVYPDRTTRPPRAAATHDRLAEQLNHQQQET